MNYEELLKKLAEVDWKSESEDILYAVREAYKEVYPFLAEKNFDELAENFAAEQTVDFIDALGQEISSQGYLLYEIDADSDSYLLTVIPMDDEAEFKELFKKKRKRVILRKQSRRNIGDAAKRIDLKKRIPCEKFSLPSGYRPMHTIACMDGKLWLSYASYEKNRRFDNATLDITTWEPVQSEDLGIYLMEITQNADGSYIAIVGDNTLNEQGGLAGDTLKVVRGTDTGNIKEWQCIYEADWDVLKEWSAIICFENQLFTANRGDVYRIKDMDHFADSMKNVLHVGNEDIHWFPKFFVVGNTLYLYIKRAIYRWEKKKETFKQIYTLKGNDFDAEDFIPIGDHEVAFQTRPRYIARGVTEGTLTVLDLDTLSRRVYTCQYGSISKWSEKRICVLAREVKSKLPIIECFDFEKEEKRCLMYGALGKSDVNEIFETEAGTILEGFGWKYYKVENLWDAMKKCEIEMQKYGGDSKK